MNDSRGPSAPTCSVHDEYLRVPMRDGATLHARLWRPDADEPLPVVFNHDPYRSSDMRTLGRGNIFHWLARHGFVAVHLSVRGTDASEGIAADEYSEAEMRDGYDAVEWFAAQPWCNGRVAAIGTSYSAFTAVQIAMQRPPHLAAIVPINGTDDRYTDDVHYHGGLLHIPDHLIAYGVSMMALNALPTLPRHGGERWLDDWTRRLERTPFWLPIWLAHQTDGPYWRAGSLRPGYERVTCPTLVCGGWADAYRNAALRTFRRVAGPKKCIIGPWPHGYPDFPHLGAPADFTGAMIRFLDHWLKDIDTGLMEEPDLLAFMQEHARPDPRRHDAPGFWRAEAGFPPPGAGERVLHLAAGGALSDAAQATPAREGFEYRATLGTATLGWGGCPWLGAPADQRSDEALSLCYTSEALDDALHVLGNARLEVRLDCTAPVAALSAKLADVARDGSSHLVTSGVLNLTHRDSHEHPEALAPGEPVDVVLELDATGHVFRPGHRIRIALSGSDWPNSWPTPYPATTTLHLGEAGARLVLPTLPAREADPAIGLPPARLPAVYVNESRPPRREVRRDAASGRTVFAYEDASTGRLSPDYEYRQSESARVGADDDDPARASCRTAIRHTMVLPDREIESEIVSHLTSTEDRFDLTLDLEVRIDGRRHFGRSERSSFPRRLL